ncbi:MAG: hypothetical protein RMY36_008895 [Nostoc sp. SerVER01]|nr:hypothetical protein [Nostoc sp. SerVER01]
MSNQENNSPKEYSRREILLNKCRTLLEDKKYEISACGEAGNASKPPKEWTVQRKGEEFLFTIEELEAYIEQLEKEV